MRKSTFAIIAALIVILSPTRGQSAGGQVQISEARSAAVADVATAEGKKFNEAVGQAFGREHAGTIQKCAKEVKRSDLSNFELFLRSNETGVVDQVLEDPATALATCVGRKLSGWKVSAPPHAGFWVKVDVNLKPK